MDVLLFLIGIVLACAAGIVLGLCLVGGIVRKALKEMLGKLSEGFQEDVIIDIKRPEQDKKE